MDVVFDFGNVLLEWNPERLVREHFATHVPAHHSAETFARGLVDTEWVAYDNGDFDLPDLAERVAAKLHCDEGSLAAFVARIPHVLSPMPDSVESLETLFDARDSGVPMRVFYLSNMPREFADSLEQRFSWIERFDGGIFSARAGLSKPNPEIYAALEAKYAIAPTDALFLDDSLANVEAARARGWKTVHVREAHHVRAGLSDAGALRSR